MWLQELRGTQTFLRFFAYPITVRGLFCLGKLLKNQGVGPFSVILPPLPFHSNEPIAKNQAREEQKGTANFLSSMFFMNTEPPFCFPNIHISL